MRLRTCKRKTNLSIKYMSRSRVFRLGYREVLVSMTNTNTVDITYQHVWKSRLYEVRSSEMPLHFIGADLSCNEWNIHGNNNCRNLGHMYTRTYTHTANRQRGIQISRDQESAKSRERKTQENILKVCKEACLNITQKTFTSLARDVRI